MFIGKWNKSVYLTYVGLAFAILGIYIALVVGNTHVALMTLMCAGVCDMFDGKIARMCKRTKEEIQFGIELDSLVDVVCFTILPICIYMSLGLTKWYNVVSFIFLAIAGIARLAYFNVYTATEDGLAVKHYEGLPVTMAAVTFPVFYLLKFVLSAKVFGIVYSIVLVIEGFLNILKFKLTKPKGLVYPLVTVLAIIMIIIYLVLL